MKEYLYFGIILILFLCACRRPEKYSDIPEIKFISFEKNKKEQISEGGKLVFRFQDGDGDLGLNDTDISHPFDTLSYYHYNLFIDYYEKQNGIFVKIDSIENKDGQLIPFNLNARFPRLSTLPKESIDGEITHIMKSYRVPTSKFDTIQLRFFIVDRKLNHSNTEVVEIIR